MFTNNLIQENIMENKERIFEAYVDECVGYLVNLRAKEAISVDGRYVQNPIYGKALTTTDIKALKRVFLSFAREPKRCEMYDYDGSCFVPVFRSWRNRIEAVSNKLGGILGIFDDGRGLCCEVYLDDAHLIDITSKMYASFDINFSEEVA